MPRPAGRLLSRRALLLSSAAGAAAAQTFVSPTHQVAEQSLQSAKQHSAPFEVTVDIAIESPSGVVRRVPAFWAGERTWRWRYSSTESGVHRYRTEADDRDDAGLHGVEGALELETYRGANPLYRHGPLAVSDDKRYLRHQDGTPFFWLGDTWWMGLCKRLGWPRRLPRACRRPRRQGIQRRPDRRRLYPDQGFV